MKNRDAQRDFDEYGWSRDRADLDAVKLWRDSAVADAWSIEPTYQHESVERASSLRKDGFHALILTRECIPPHNYLFEAHVSVWGPDGLAIKPSAVYDWKQLVSALRHCNACGANDVDTQRYAFAGRCCQKCLPEMQRKHEYEGWTR